MGRFRYKQRSLRPADGARVGRAIEAARRCHLDGQWEQSQTFAQGILQDHPHHLEALHLASVAALQLGRPQDACELLGQAVRLDASSAMFHGQMGTALRALGRLEEAAASYRLALSLAPRRPEHYNNLGNALRELGRTAESMECYRRGLCLEPRHPALLTNLGNVLRDQGQIPEALDLYRRALAIEEGFLDARVNLADGLKQQGRLVEAMEEYERLLAVKPDMAPAYHNLGVALQNEGKLQEAARCYEKVLTLQPNLVQAHANLGNVYRQEGKLADALRCLEKAVELDPGLAGAHNNLGATLQALERPDEALRCFHRAIELAPDDAQAHNNAGNAYAAREEFGPALEHLEKARALQPDFAEVYNNLGNVLRGLGRLDEALAAYRQAVQLKPAFADGYSNLGNGFKDLGDFRQAVAAYQKAIELDPATPGYRWNKALAELTAGDLERGWEDYEAGFACKQRQSQRPFPQPRWEGQSLIGQTILTWGEQGVGDEIIFANCLPDLAAAADRVVVECDPRLAPLFARSFADCEVVPRTTPADGRTGWPDIDLQSPMGTLPRWLRPTLDRFSPAGGYLLADPVRVEHWRARLEALGTGLKVGISWRSRVMNASRARLCVPIEAWEPVLRTPGVQFVNLQYCNWEDDLAEARRRFGVCVHHFDDLDLKDALDDVAALVSALDLTITISNALMTLGGALNAATWVFALKDHMDWLTLGADFVPWFPGVRLFYRTWRQSWEPVVTAMAHELRGRAAR
jgi:tetratricopeptide (TPR) repeat protein